ncbi:MAG TPA: putative sulfate exporter family transporter [Thermoanaerobaculia bacterium]|nr:putative sulfate exporter family transporter [Thermoanaerobaculia bacterium]
MTRILPGLLAAVGVTLVSSFFAVFAGRWVASLQTDQASVGGNPVSPVIVAILLGLLISVVFGVRPVLKPGTDFAMKTLLRAGIILVGIRLSLLDVLELGAIGVPFVATIIIAAVLLSRWLARRLGVSENFGLLTAAATSICGITAALATAPAIRADEREVAYAVANTTLFGMLAMLIYPWVANAVFGASSIGAGLFLGTSIHDTSQVVGAALAYRQMFGDELAFKAATVTKLTRNLFIIAIVPLLGWLAARRRGAGGEETSAARASWSTLVPLFVLGFLGMALIRTLGDLSIRRGGTAFGLIEPADWLRLTDLLGSSISGWLLATAMAAVGLSTNLAAFRKLGSRPLWLGALVALAVGALGLVLALAVAPFVRL